MPPRSYGSHHWMGNRGYLLHTRNIPLNMSSSIGGHNKNRIIPNNSVCLSFSLCLSNDHLCVFISCQYSPWTGVTIEFGGCLFYVAWSGRRVEFTGKNISLFFVFFCDGQPLWCTAQMSKHCKRHLPWNKYSLWPKSATIIPLFCSSFHRLSLSRQSRIKADRKRGSLRKNCFSFSVIGDLLRLVVAHHACWWHYSNTQLPKNKHRLPKQTFFPESWFQEYVNYNGHQDSLNQRFDFDVRFHFQVTVRN